MLDIACAQAYPRQVSGIVGSNRRTALGISVNEGEEAAVMLLVVPVVTIARVCTPWRYMLHCHPPESIHVFEGFDAASINQQSLTVKALILLQRTSALQLSRF